mgnify:CR=1 FL=1
MLSNNEPKLWLWRHLPRRCKALFNNNVLMFLYVMRDYEINPDVIDVEAIDCDSVDAMMHSLRNFKKPNNNDVDSMEIMQLMHDITEIEKYSTDKESIPEVVNAVYDIITKYDIARYDNVANLRMRKLNYVIEHLL